MSALGCWSLSRNMWTPIISLETETFYKSSTVVMKKVTFFFKSSTIVMPVIIYIMDYISAAFVCWFKISLFHSVVCFVSAFMDWQMVFRSLSHFVVISNFSQAAQVCRLLLRRKMLPAVLYWRFLLGTKADFGVTYCLSSLFLKTSPRSRYFGKDPAEERYTYGFQGTLQCELAIEGGDS